MKKLLLGATMLFALATLLAGCGGSSGNRAARDGDTVSVNYVGTLEDGTQFDSSYDRGQPLTFVLGAGRMIAGFDAAVTGMKVGETKTVTLSPDEAYGQHKDSLVITLDRDKFPEDLTLAVGQQVPLKSSSGQQTTGVITDIQPGSVTLDLNPVLAGKTLIFEITLENITPGSG
jgi:FKBP-type peptidyl-prolyl cis-trans isomerase 2